jgi:hypothetical protein
MAIKNSGPLSLTEIQAEYGGSAPISLSEYYSGGGQVPSPAPTSAYQIGGAIPTSGAIRMGSFYGTSKITNFVVGRYAMAVDRITHYRVDPNGEIGVVASTSWNTNIWNQIIRLPAVSFAGGTASAFSYPAMGERLPGAITIVHQPTQAQPYIEFVVNDDGPPGASQLIVQVTINGVVGGPLYTGPFRGGMQGNQPSVYGIFASDETPPAPF